MAAIRTERNTSINGGLKIPAFKEMTPCRFVNKYELFRKVSGSPT